MAGNAALPVGIVTFVLTDIESSTPLWDDHPDHMPNALALQERIIEKVVEANGGHWLKSRGEGDSTLSVFARATDAFTAAVELQRQLERQVWPGDITLRTRIALHTGESQMRDGDYIGGVLNRAARIRGMAKGGEIVLSRATHDVVADVLPTDIALIELGEHQMRGLRRPEFLYLVSGGGLPTPAPRGRADVRLSGAAGDELIGRRELLDDLEDVLARPGVVTLVGPGGIGKTRSCAEACDRVRARFERVVFVDLVGVRDPIAVEAVVQQALTPERGVPIFNDEPDAGGFLEATRAALGTDRVLLVVDNCEHVATEVTSVVRTLTSDRPNVSILATSRVPLAVTGETVVRVKPLEVPTRGAEANLAALASVESVRLLLNRTHDAGADLQLTAANAPAIAQLCRQLDGIPLAIELAAARLTSTSPGDLLARMSRSLDLLRSPGGDSRHRTLDDAIDWSYQLLEASEQTLLRRLAVFVGGFTLDAAESICAGDSGDDDLPTADDVFLNLAELVSKSLVVFDRDRDRYRMLEPIRFFARLKFDASDDAAATARRHADWVFRISRSWMGRQVVGRQGGVYRPELDNVHAALDWLCAAGDNTAFMRIVAVCGYTWLESEWRRGREDAEIGMQMASSADVSPRLRAGVSFSRGILEQRISPVQSIPYLEMATALHADIGDDVGQAWSLLFLGRAVVRHDRTRGVALLEEAIDLFTRISQTVGAVWCLVNLATDANDRGDLEASHRYLLRARDVVDRSGLVTARGIVMCEQAVNAVERGELDEGRALFREGIALMRSSGDQWNLIGSLAHSAWAEFEAGALDDAAALLIEAIENALDRDDAWQRNEAMLVYAVVCLAAGDPWTARTIMAATGWDAELPVHIATHARSLVAQSIVALEPLLASEYDEAASEGRRIGSVAMAESLVATHASR
jgi:predicted ATPase/class 3 adenylate cyclase